MLEANDARVRTNKYKKINKEKIQGHVTKYLEYAINEINEQISSRIKRGSGELHYYTSNFRKYMLMDEFVISLTQAVTNKLQNCGYSVEYISMSKVRYDGYISIKW